MWLKYQLQISTFTFPLSILEFVQSAGLWRKTKTMEVTRHFQTRFLQTHLLACDQQDGSLLGMDHLPENMVEDEEFTPAVLQ